MSSNTIFSSIESEKRWVLAMEKNFPQEHIVDINFLTPTSIFKIPKTLTETNPEAYTPQHLGLGPYHHLRPEIYPMQKPKLAAVKNYLEPKNPQSFQKVVEALVQFEPFIRQCYDQYLDLDIQTLAWILTIDGLYLLQFLENYSQNNREELITGDIMMLENQIPVIILKRIRQALQLCQDDEADYLLFNQFHCFCEAQSPLKLNEQVHVLGDVSQVHMLHRMYYLIVNNRGIKVEHSRKVEHSQSLPISLDDANVFERSLPMSLDDANVFEILLPSSLDDVNVAFQFVTNQVPAVSTAGKILSFMENVPWDKILTLFKKGGSGSDEQNISVEEIDIPSVSQMTEVAGIKFRLTPGGIRDIQFVDHGHGEEKKFYLPVITLNSNSEIILRNLVAFEAAALADQHEFTDYVDLMCGIIDTPKDVGILREEKIIESELPDEEIARVFNGIGKSSKKSDQKSKIEEVIDQVNKNYDGVSRVKVGRFLKKYVYASLKILSVLVSIAVLVLLVLNSFCSVFGCGRWFGKDSVTHSHNLLWSDQ